MVSFNFQVKEPFVVNKLVQVAKLPDRGPDPELDELYVVGHGDQEVRQSLIYFFDLLPNISSFIS